MKRRKKPVLQGAEAGSRSVVRLCLSDSTILRSHVHASCGRELSYHTKFLSFRAHPCDTNVQARRNRGGIEEDKEKYELRRHQAGKPGAGSFCIFADQALPQPPRDVGTPGGLCPAAASCAGGARGVLVGELRYELRAARGGVCSPPFSVMQLEEI